MLICFSMSWASHQRNPLVYFHNSGVGSTNEIDTHDWSLHTFGTLLKQLGNDQVLQIYIRSEWRVITL